MKTLPPALTLRQFDLLPPSYRYQNRLRQLRRSWLAVVLSLSAVLCGASAASFLRVHRQRQENAQLASTAMPLKVLRNDVIRLQAENRQRSQWCQWVESARPDDSALQALAAIALASSNGNRQILIDSVHMRLSVEPPPAEKTTPWWAQPMLAIHARAVTEEAVQGWIDRMNRLDRLENPALVTEDAKRSPSLRLIGDRLLPVQLTALPRATRVLP